MFKIHDESSIKIIFIYMCLYFNFRLAFHLPQEEFLRLKLLLILMLMELFMCLQEIGQLAKNRTVSIFCTLSQLISVKQRLINLSAHAFEQKIKIMLFQNKNDFSPFRLKSMLTDNAHADKVNPKKLQLKIYIVYFN